MEAAAAHRDLADQLARRYHAELAAALAKADAEDSRAEIRGQRHPGARREPGQRDYWARRRSR
jgi:hypothetical protein